MIWDHWLQDILPAKQLSETTIYHYRIRLRRYLCPKFGTRRVTTIGTAESQQFLSFALVSGGKEGQGLSPRAVRMLYDLFKVLFSLAQRDGWIVDNPVALDRLTLPALRPPHHKIWTPEMAQRFVDVARQDPLGPLFILALSTGMRQGELLALQWRDVQWDPPRDPGP
jgi:integrase